MAVASVSLFGGAVAQAQAPGNIDSDASGSLTLHKHLHANDYIPTRMAPAAADGPISGTPPAWLNDPVEGVGFTIYPLLGRDGAPVDLTDNTAWEGLNNANLGLACAAPDGYQFGTGIPMPLTGADGITTTRGLDVTAYVVCETSAPPNIVDRSAPFMLTIPMPDEGEWIYDVHAYPKNGAGSIVKSITPQLEDGLGVGSQIEWPVTAPVPLLQNETWTGFAISDTFDSRLTPVGVNEVRVGTTVLNESQYSVDIVGQTITMRITDLDALPDWDNPNADFAGQELTVDFNTTINSIGDGIVPNTAQLWINNPGMDESVRPPLPSNEVRSNWGALQLIKEDSASGNELAGATFEVYNADPAYGTCADASPTGDAINVGGRTEFTSNESGVVSVPGLFVSDSVHSPQDGQERCYVVRETAAPSGYVLPEDANTGVTVRIGGVTETANSYAIANTQQGAPDLPLTGGAGTGAMVGLGAILVLGAGGVALARNRDKDAAEAAGTSA